MDVLKTLSPYGPDTSGSLVSSLSNWSPDKGYGQLTLPVTDVPGGDAVNSGTNWLGSFGNWLTGGKDDVTGKVTNSGLGSILGVAQGLGNAYMGMQQLSLAKKALAQSKEQFGKNYEAQKRTTNASLEDRQRARLAANPGGYESVGNYMQKNAIL